MAPVRRFAAASLLKIKALQFRSAAGLPNFHPHRLPPLLEDLPAEVSWLASTRIALRCFFSSSLDHVPELSGSGQWEAVLKVEQRSYAKAKKSKGDEESSHVSEDSYPKLKETTVKQMEAALDALSRELSKLRTGRASSGMLDHVTVVDSNGLRSPLNHVAAVSVVDNQRLRVTPYDSSVVKAVERGIRSSPLQLNPVCEGDILTVPIPKPTKEHIETMTKLVGKAAETAKLSLRRSRQNAMDAIKKSSGSISKDDIKRREKEIEEMTKKFVKASEDLCKAKEKEMTLG